MSKKKAAPKDQVDLADNETAFTYEGKLTGGYSGVGYVEPGKVVLATSDYARQKIDEAPKGTFTPHAGALTRDMIAQLPDEYSSPEPVATPRTDDEVQEPTRTEGD